MFILLLYINDSQISFPIKAVTLDFGISVGHTFINFGFFPGPTSLFKGPMFIDLWNYFKTLQTFLFLFLHKFATFVLSDFFQQWQLTQNKFFISTKFILFVKYFRPYVYSLPYVYSGV